MNTTIETIKSINKPISIYATDIEQEALNQFYEAMILPCNVAGALMPDAHTGYTLPIGAVVKSQGVVFPAYVGYDIGCGMCAAKLNITHTKEAPINLNLIKTLILERVPLGALKHKEPQNYALDECSNIAKEIYQKVGAFQLGSLGSGNHFIELGVDRQNFVWIVVHSGSRGFGKQVAEHYMERAVSEYFDKICADKITQKFDSDNAEFAKRNKERFLESRAKFVEKSKEKFIRQNAEGHYALELSSPIGQEYLKDLKCALNFALENRKRMVNAILDSINEACGGGVEMTEFINKNHNHAIILEDGSVLHRKGATDAQSGEMGVIPGNMKDGSFIIKGRGCVESLWSSSHGAGRILSRNVARKSLNLSEFHKEMEGIVTNHTDAMLDEAPKAYKDIFAVMEAQKDMVEVVEHIRPILNLKG